MATTFHRFSSLTFYSGSAAILAAAMHVVMARLLGPGNYATYGTFVALLTTVLFSTMSVHLLISRVVTYHRSRSQYEQIAYFVSRALDTLFAIGFVLFVLILTFSSQISAYFGLDEVVSTVMFGFVVWFTLLVPLFEGALKGVDQYHQLGKLRVIESTLRIVFAVAAVLLGFSVAGALFGLGLGTIFALAFAYHAVEKLKRKPFHTPDLSGVWRLARPILISIIGLSFLLNLDIIIVKHYFDPVAAGIFAVSSFYVKVPFLIAMVYATVLFPKVAQLHVDGHRSTHELKRGLFIVGLIALLFVIVGVWLGGPIFAFIFGPAYQVTWLLGLYALGMGVLSLCCIVIVYLLAINDFTVAYIPPVFLVGLWLLLEKFHSSELAIMLSVLLVTCGLGVTLFLRAKSHILDA